MGGRLSGHAIFGRGNGRGVNSSNTASRPLLYQGFIAPPPKTIEPAEPCAYGQRMPRSIGACQERSDVTTPSTADDHRIREAARSPPDPGPRRPGLILPIAVLTGVAAGVGGMLL